MPSGLVPRRRSAPHWCLAALCTLAGSSGCDERPASPSSAPPRGVAPSTPRNAPEAPSLVESQDSLAAPDAGAPPGDAGPPPPYAGPYFTVVSGSTGIYAEPSSDRARKLGYARSGGRLPVLPDVVLTEGCQGGYHPLVGGGYICAAEGSLDPNDPRVRLAGQAPNLGATLPYLYARNAQNGTPLYSSVPSRDQIALYEPYLQPPIAERAGAEPGTLSWWQRKEASLSDVRLAELALESDGVLGRRMVKGFYIAIDTQFEWSERSWYKTTKGMIAPKDRFVAVEGYGFHGVELQGDLALPVAWVYARDSRPTYVLDDAGKPKASGTAARHEPIPLSDESVEIDGQRYLRARGGFWLRADHVRVANTPPIPISVTPDERWIYVDLRTQTLVALLGPTPAYATLISSGKESEIEDKDHRTPPGEWHIREKHVTTTMDGDGTAAGDLPYSIEDVPYVMYFQGSYALHGAFWHRNFGVRMSHGCINLAPLDAKYLFFFTGPSVREGWHGAWSGNGQTGSRVVIDGPVRESAVSARTQPASARSPTASVRPPTASVRPPAASVRPPAASVRPPAPSPRGTTAVARGASSNRRR